ncbi:hypothetical protein FAGKG844_10081 [Frankia sp. AgKG'84/4]
MARGAWGRGHRDHHSVRVPGPQRQGLSSGRVVRQPPPVAPARVGYRIDGPPKRPAAGRHPREKNNSAGRNKPAYGLISRGVFPSTSGPVSRPVVVFLPPGVGEASDADAGRVRELTIGGFLSRPGVNLHWRQRCTTPPTRRNHTNSQEGDYAHSATSGDQSRRLSAEAEAAATGEVSRHPRAGAVVRL